MSFNKNASKRLCTVAGIDRESCDIVYIIDDIARTYIDKLLQTLVTIVLFSGRKTIKVDDIRFLSQICPDQSTVVCSTNFSSMVTMCTSKQDIEQAMYGHKGYAMYTVKKPFDCLVRDIVRKLYNEEIRIGKNVAQLLQNMTEQYVINVLSQSATYTRRYNRETLLALDIETAMDYKGVALL